MATLLLASLLVTSLLALIYPLCFQDNRNGEISLFVKCRRGRDLIGTSSFLDCLNKMRFYRKKLSGGHVACQILLVLASSLLGSILLFPRQQKSSKKYKYWPPLHFTATGIHPPVSETTDPQLAPSYKYWPPLHFTAPGIHPPVSETTETKNKFNHREARHTPYLLTWMPAE